MIDLREEFNKIMDQYGVPVILIRSNKKQECNCVDQLYRAPKPGCPVCLGTGYINKVERIKIRNIGSSSIDIFKFSDIGQAVIVPSKFYIKYNDTPNRNDMIITCAWDGDKPVMDQYTDIYLIDNIEPMRGDNGRIEYFRTTCESSPINKDIKLHNIIKNNNEVRYYITAR